MSLIDIEITDATEFHCFKLTLHAKIGPEREERHEIEIMLHASALVELLHQGNLALCEWQRQTTEILLEKITGLSPDEMRERRIIA